MKFSYQSCYSMLVDDLLDTFNLYGYSETVNSGPNETLHQSVLGTTKSNFQWLKLNSINYDRVTKPIEMDVILKPKSNSRIRGHWNDETVKRMTAAVCMRAEFPSWTAPRPSRTRWRHRHHRRRLRRSSNRNRRTARCVAVTSVRYWWGPGEEGGSG